MSNQEQKTSAVPSVDALSQGSRHTPGPWVITRNGHGWIVQRETELAYYLAQVVMQPTHAETEANARLMAAAPELLAALERLRDLDVNCSQEEDRAAWEQACKAIAKCKT